jgi:hypothetical protein
MAANDAAVMGIQSAVVVELVLEPNSFSLNDTVTDFVWQVMTSWGAFSSACQCGKHKR